MRINNNLMAMNTHRQLGNAQANGAKSMQKLSSGFRINNAADDAAGLSISEKMRGQIRGLNQASRNSQDGISMIQTAEGALDETHNILQRMRELMVQAGNGTNESEDLKSIKDEMDALVQEIDGISERTEFNGKTLLDGTYSAEGGIDTSGAVVASGAAESVTFQIGANDNQNLELNIGNMSADGLGTLASGGTVAFAISEIDVTASGLRGAASGDTHFDNQLATIDDAIQQVSDQRSQLGATQNRLEHTISNLNNAGENLQAAESRVRDVDMAKEMMEMTKNNILQQASTAMLAQANQAPQSVLQLLG